MIYYYFPNDIKDQKYLLDIFRREIIRRTDWTLAAANELNIIISGKIDTEAKFITDNIIRKSTEIINHAMAVLKIFEISGTLKNKEIKTARKERINFIKNYWPDYPKPPEKLRNMRNNLEHFEERIDEWIINSCNYNFVDVHVGPPIEGIEITDHFRRFDRDNLYFWGESINLTEVCNWLQNLVDYIQDNN